MGMIMKDGVPYGGVYPIDDVPTQGSDNTVKSGGVFSAIEPNTEAIEAINENGCCNILDNNLPSETSGNVTWTVNADKTVTASSSGQSVSGLEHHEINHSYTLQPGTYKLSGGVDSNNYIELLETNYDYTGIIDTGDGYEFTVSSAHTYIVLLRSGNGVVNAEFKPMIYDARLKPTGYVSHAMTNRELTRAVDRGSVFVTSNGVKTYRQLLNELYSKIEFSRITKDSCLLSVGSWGYVNYQPDNINDSKYVFASVRVSVSTGIYIESVEIKQNDSTFVLYYNGNIDDRTDFVAQASLVLYY